MPISYPSTRPTNNQIRPIFTFFFFKRFFLFYLHFICAFLVRAQTYPIYMYDYFSHLKLLDCLAQFLLSLYLQIHSLFLKPSIYSFWNFTDVIICHVLLIHFKTYYFLFSDFTMFDADKDWRSLLLILWPNWRKFKCILLS